MKVLTIKQPWASLIISGDKKFEFRTWRTNFRGKLLIHAGKGKDKQAMERLTEYLPMYLPQGEIIGEVEIVDCIQVTEDIKKELLSQNNKIYQNVLIGDYAWKIDKVKPYTTPIKINGKLGLWNYEKHY